MNSRIAQSDRASALQAECFPFKSEYGYQFGEVA